MDIMVCHAMNSEYVYCIYIYQVVLRQYDFCVRVYLHNYSLIIY